MTINTDTALTADTQADWDSLDRVRGDRCGQEESAAVRRQTWGNPGAGDCRRKSMLPSLFPLPWGFLAR